MDMMWYRRRGLMVTPHIERVTGAIASFNSAYNKIPIKSLNCNIEPIQSGSGDPSPENVRPISGRTGLSVERVGVNVWDEEWENGYYNRATGIKDGNRNTTYFRSKNYIPCVPNTSYYFKAPSVHASNATYYAVLYYDADKNYISAINSGIGDTVRTTPENAHFMTFYIEAVTSGATYNHDISINYPSTDTEYHPYQGSTYSVNWQTEAGTVYGGYVDVVSGKLVVDRAMVDLGTLTWVYISSDKRFYCRIYGWKEYTTSQVANAICSQYYPVSRDNLLSFDKCFSISSNVLSFINIRDTAYSDATTFKTAMNGVQLVYELATPTEIQLTPQEVRALLDENNIWCDSGDVTVDYWKWGR